MAKDDRAPSSVTSSQRSTQLERLSTHRLRHPADFGWQITRSRCWRTALQFASSETLKEDTAMKIVVGPITHVSA